MRSLFDYAAKPTFSETCNRCIKVHLNAHRCNGPGTRRRPIAGAALSSYTGAHPLPRLNSVPADLPHAIHQYIGDYGYLAVFLGIFFEDFGLPVPGETLLVTAAAVAGRQALNIWILAGVAWLGAVLGDNVGFLIGHSGGHVLLTRYGRRIGITPARLVKVERFVERYGAPVIVFARFVVVARQLNGVAAGSLGMHWLRFLVCNCLGAALWVGFWGTLAYWLGKKIVVLFNELRSIEPAAIAVGAVVVIGGGVYLWRHMRGQSGKT